MNHPYRLPPKHTRGQTIALYAEILTYIFSTYFLYAAYGVTQIHQNILAIFLYFIPFSSVPFANLLFLGLSLIALPLAFLLPLLMALLPAKAVGYLIFYWINPEELERNRQ